MLGNLIRHTNFNNVVITNAYDAMNRLTNRSSVNGYRVGFTYTPGGQRQSMSDPSGTTSYGYDSRDRLALKTAAWTGGPTVSLNYRYDANGNLTNLWSSTANGVTNFYRYDALSRLTNALGRDSVSAGYTFDGVGNLQTVRYGNGVTNRYRYDALNRLTNALWKLNAGTLGDFTYQLGLAGHRTNLSEMVNGTARNYAWTYDALYRLKQEAITGGTVGTLDYDYDAVGNRTGRTRTGAGLSLTNQSFTFNPNDWVSTDAYDANGNTLWSTNGPLAGPYAYDVENRLTNFNNGAVLIGYNGDGARVKKTVGDTTTYYLVDDRNPSGYAQVVEEHVSLNNQPATLNWVFDYGLDLISQREVASSTIYYFVYDGHGSTRALYDGGGSFINAFAYDAYGTLIASNGAPQTAYLNCGEYLDSDLGLVYLRARYLNPGTGRFWTRDTFEGTQTDPLSFHKYLYAHNNPINNTDPSGNAAEATAIGQVGVANIQFTIQTAYLRTAAFATATALTDYFSRQQLFLFHVTDATIVQIAQTYNGGAFRAASSSKPMFFATTSTHVASLLLYGVGYPIAIYTGLFDKPIAAGIAAFAADLGVSYASLPPNLKKPSGKPVIILTSKKNSITAKIWFNGGINVQGVGYVPLIYSTFTTAPGEMVRPQNYKLIPLP